jgi:hypothetical protein
VYPMKHLQACINVMMAADVESCSTKPSSSHPLSVRLLLGLFCRVIGQSMPSVRDLQFRLVLTVLWENQ